MDMRNAGPASPTIVPGSEQPASGSLRDLAFSIGTEVGGLAGRLSPATTTAIGDLVRGMNCYYSNLIEGHDTRPIDIDRALKDDFAGDARRRNLQLEAAAHIGVQAAIDAGELDHLAAPSALAVSARRGRAGALRARGPARRHRRPPPPPPLGTPLRGRERARHAPALPRPAAADRHRIGPLVRVPRPRA
ncbi:hypothetical protein NRP21_23555 [Roseomonas pecuniae]|uniref:Uncharacterized protein n=1 Tax=Roseomonas populi TaxID=3121582 RepID=A0ABT1XAA6_9PROT|nr:hypothetical protein [Roseomonas pecuniae]MCR0985034.1 hypothetical protein [Roseomonas pecuniae]